MLIKFGLKFPTVWGKCQNNSGGNILTHKSTADPGFAERGHGERADREPKRGSEALVLEVFLNVMRYINPRFTYLLTYLLTLWG